MLCILGIFATFRVLKNDNHHPTIIVVDALPLIDTTGRKQSAFIDCKDIMHISIALCTKPVGNAAD